MYTNSERFKTKGVHNVSTNAERLKRFHRLHGNQVLLGGSIWRTQEGIDRNWGRFKINLFSFGKFCLFQVRITNILPGFVWTEGVYFIQYMCVCVCLWSTCLFVCACLWPSSMIILYFCKCLTHVLKGLQWMLTDEKSRADFTKFGFGDPDEVISQRWITFVF